MYTWVAGAACTYAEGSFIEKEIEAACGTGKYSLKNQSPVDILEYVFGV